MDTLTKTYVKSHGGIYEALALSLGHLLPEGYVVADGWEVDRGWESVIVPFVEEADYEGHILTPAQYAPILAFDMLIGNGDRNDGNHGITADGTIVLFDNAEAFDTAENVLMGYVTSALDWDTPEDFLFMVEAIRTPEFAGAVERFNTSPCWMDLAAACHREGGWRLFDNLAVLREGMDELVEECLAELNKVDVLD